VKAFIQTGTIMAAGLMLWLFFDFMYIRSGQNYNSVWSSDWFLYPLFTTLPASLYVICFNSLKHKPSAQRSFLSFIISGVLTFFWFLIAIPLVVNFHLFAGGTL